MERETWSREYLRLCAAYGRAPNAEQMGVYFTALADFPSVCVGESVTDAIRESRGWPTAADLAERARQARSGKFAAPAGVCDLCHGELWLVAECTPEQPCGARHDTMASFPVRGGGRTAAVPYRHTYAVKCYQCRPARLGAA